MSKFKEINNKIATTIIDGYQKIENAVIGRYQKIEDKFVDKYLKKENETSEEAKIRLKKEKHDLEKNIKK